MKTPHSDNQEASRIEKEAAEWVLKNDRGLTADEQDALTDWLVADTRHKEAYALFGWGWDELDRLAGLQTKQPIPIDEDLLNIIPEEHPISRRFSNRWLLTGLAMAACLTLFLTIGIRAFYESVTPAVVESPIVYERIQQINLGDGSRVELNHGAVVSAAYSETERAVYLLEGEANFSVAKDPDRPFVVYVSGIRLCALGTVFNVRYQSEKVDLIVTEGRVQVLDSETEERPFNSVTESPIIETSQRAIVSLDAVQRDLVVRQLNPSEIENELIWRPELIDFNDEFLPVIVEDFNRRNRVQIFLEDPALEDLKLTSIFWSDNVEAFVRLLESNFKVRVERRNQFEIYLSLYS